MLKSETTDHWHFCVWPDLVSLHIMWCTFTSANISHYKTIRTPISYIYANCSLAPYLFISGFKRDKTMADKSMYIPNNNTQNYPLLVETFEISTWLTNQSKFTTFPNLLNWRIRKRYCKTLGTSLINSSLSLSLS